VSQTKAQLLDGKSATIQYSAGSASTPAISFTGDTNTGIYSPGADQVAISTNGSGRLFVDSNGNLGVGISSIPNYNANLRTVSFNNTNGVVHDYAVGGTRTGSLVCQSGSFEISTQTNIPLVFSTNSNERMRLTATGLGIGTTSPSTRLHIYQTSSTQAGLVETDQSASVINFKSTGQSSGQPQIGCAASDMILNTAGSERARIDSSGRLLVGTSTVINSSYGGTSGLLQVAKNDFLPIGFYTYSDIAGETGYCPYVELHRARGTKASPTVVASGDDLGLINFYGHDGSTFIRSALIKAVVDGTPGASDMPGRLVFSTTANSASTPTKRMTIFNGGFIDFDNCPSINPGADNSTSLGAAGQRYTAVYAVNGTIQTSDQREKQEISDAVLGVDFIKSLRPVSYKWIEGGKRHNGEYDENNDWIYESVPGARTHWGFIAQEVKQAVDVAGVDFGGWVLTDKDDPDSQQALRYDQFIAPLTKALQETMAELEALKAEVAALKAQ
jgi:hypothetical protein